MRSRDGGHVMGTRTFGTVYGLEEIPDGTVHTA